MPTPSEPSFARRLTFILLTAVGMVVLLEVGAAMLLVWSDGAETGSGQGRAATQRDALVGVGQEKGDGDSLTVAGADRLAGREVIHPFVGFTKIPDAGEVRGGIWSEAAPAFEDRLIFEPSDDRVVIGVLGGSVADIVAAGGSGLATELLQLERFADREIEVISLAQGGFKQPQQVLLLTYLLSLGAHFDVVLNLDGFNEVVLPAVELVPRGVFPFYPRAWDQRVSAIDSEPRRLAGSLKEQQARRRSLAQFFAGQPLRSSRAATLLWRILDRRHLAAVGELERQLLSAGSEEASYGSRGPRRDYASGDELVEDLARSWYRSSLQLHHLCRGLGIEYRHFLQPNQYVPGAKPLEAEREARTWLADHPYRQAVEAGYPALQRWGAELAAQGVDFADLAEVFAGHEELLYGDACCHFNFLGNTLLQRAIARHLSNRAPSLWRAENLSDGGLALHGYDPVSYFDGQPTPGVAEITAELDGELYRFANAANRDRFLADAGSFRPQFGGWCAFGLGLDEKEFQIARERYPVDPLSYAVQDGKLYLFYRSPIIDGQALWRRDPARYVERAEEAWRRIRSR